MAVVNTCLVEDNVSRQTTTRGNLPSKSTSRESERIYTLGESGYNGEDTLAKDLADKEISALVTTVKGRKKKQLWPERTSNWVDNNGGNLLTVSRLDTRNRIQKQN